MEKIVQTNQDHRFIIKKLSENRYDVTFQEYSAIRNQWITLSREMADESWVKSISR